MPEQQSSTNQQSKPEGGVADPRHLLYIDYTAAAGLVIDEGGKMRTVSVEEFAKSLGVHRTTLYQWQKQIPDFWQKVNDRLPEVYSKMTRVIYRGLSLRAAKGDAHQATLLLNQLDKLKPKVEKSTITHEFPQPVLAQTSKEPDVRRDHSDSQDQSS